MSAWDRGAYALQRRCSCRKGQRTAECAAQGWHTVDTDDTATRLHADARDLESNGWGEYRVTVVATGVVL